MNDYDYFDHAKPRKRNWRASVAAATAALVLGGGVLTWSQFANATGSAPKTEPVRLTVSNKPVTREPGVTTFAPVVKKVTPSVVQVYVTGKARTVSQHLPEGFGDHPWLRRFFGENFSPEQFGGRTPQPRQRGLGSGVIVTQDGYLLTNNHVVENADEVKVALNDGREFTAKVVGKDPKSDIAVLKIDANNLPAVEVADSDNIEVGDVVLAVGNPFGIGQTVTTGIVSATGRGRPTPPSIPAIPAARSWMRMDASLASTQPSSAAAVATRASGSPCRSTWRVPSWRASCRMDAWCAVSWA
jgi:serine protease Do